LWGSLRMSQCTVAASRLRSHQVPMSVPKCAPAQVPAQGSSEGESASDPGPSSFVTISSESPGQETRSATRLPDRCKKKLNKQKPHSQGQELCLTWQSHFINPPDVGFSGCNHVGTPTTVVRRMLRKCHELDRSTLDSRFAFWRKAPFPGVHHRSTNGSTTTAWSPHSSPPAACRNTRPRACWTRRT
jgi:hypothetical protein